MGYISHKKTSTLRKISFQRIEHIIIKNKDFAAFYIH